MKMVRWCDAVMTSPTYMIAIAPTTGNNRMCRIVSISRDVGCSMLANEPTRSYIGPTRGRAQLYLRSTYVHRSSNHNTKLQKNLVVVIHPYDRTRPTNRMRQRLDLFTILKICGLSAEPVNI